jgi:hypothetical protein
VKVILISWIVVMCAVLVWSVYLGYEKDKLLFPETLKTEREKVSAECRQHGGIPVWSGSASSVMVNCVFPPK